MSIPAVSQLLRKLKDGNIIETKKERQTIYYSLTQENLKILKPFFKHINQQTLKTGNRMISIKPSGGFTSAGVLSAIAASLCCITPVIALFTGSSSIAANFSWIEQARALIGLSISVLAFAWYLKLKPAKIIDVNCNCESTKKTSFLQSKTFLGFVTIFSILMMTFPIYAKMLTPQS